MPYANDAFVQLTSLGVNTSQGYLKLGNVSKRNPSVPNTARFLPSTVYLGDTVWTGKCLGKLQLTNEKVVASNVFD